MKPRPIQIGVELVDERGRRIGSLEDVIRRVVRDELERLVQSPEDRELQVRAIVRDELASLGGHLLGDSPEPLSWLGGYMTEHYGDRTVVHGTGHASSGTSGGG